MTDQLSELDLTERESKFHFDRWAQNYDKGRISPWFQYTQSLALEALDLRPDSEVLDIGCGTGYAVRKVASLLPRGKACGIDISPRMIDEARRRVPPVLQERVEFRQANSASVPYPDCTFSHILCTNSFHHYPDPMKALAEMKRLLGSGGQLVIFENATDLSWYTRAWDRALRIIERGHVRYYTSGELGKMIEQAGFEKVTLCLLRNVLLKYGKLFASIQMWSMRKPPD